MCIRDRNSDAVKLSGIWDIDEKRRQLAESRGIHAYSSLEEVLSDPQVDLVTIAVPNDVHRELAVAALQAGKNVISEKPVTLSCEDLSAMFAAADASGKRFTVHQNRRWDVDYLAMQQLCNSGELGEVFRIESRIHGSRGIPSDWRREKEHGGGMLYDWGVHLIDQMLLLFPDEITRVSCEFTHITEQDVYKRQERRCPQIASGGITSNPWALQRMIPSVSYTHLAGTYDEYIEWKNAQAN